MKRIYWQLKTKEVIFNVNWFEYLVLKHIFKKQKYQYLKPTELTGYEVNVVMIDEANYIPKRVFTKSIKNYIRFEDRK